MSLLERTGASTIKVKPTLPLAHLFRTKTKWGSDCSLPTELCEAVAALHVAQSPLAHFLQCLPRNGGYSLILLLLELCSGFKARKL